MFIELTRRSDGKKIKVSKHAIGYMEDVGIIEWKKENLFKKGKWVEDTKDRFTELNILESRFMSKNLFKKSKK